MEEVGSGLGFDSFICVVLTLIYNAYFSLVILYFLPRINKDIILHYCLTKHVKKSIAVIKIFERERRHINEGGFVPQFRELHSWFTD